MAEASKKILLVGTPQAFDAALMPVLSRTGFAVDRLRPSFAILELINRIRFDLIGLGAEIQEPGLVNLIDEIRSEGGCCRTSSVVVVQQGELSPTTKAALDAGANLVLNWPMPIEQALTALARLLQVSPRKSTRIMTRLTVHLGAGSKKLIGRSENLSVTGMLVSVGEKLEPGTQFDIEFSLGGDPAPIRGVGHVVRQAGAPGNSSQWVGIQFLSLAGDSRQRLEKYLAGA